VLAYERLRTHGAEDQLGAYHLAPRNLNLASTSSWINYYLGRDHSAERLGIPPVPAPADPPQPPKEVKKC
jgi:methylenetetrahydrofolate reductase (NADPH)